MTGIWVFPKIRGKPPKWRVKIMENPIKMDDLGVKPTIFGNTRIFNYPRDPGSASENGFMKSKYLVEEVQTSSDVR